MSTDARLSGNHRASITQSHLAPPDTVENVVSNVGPRRAKPIPCGMHFIWFFEAAGYQVADLAGEEFSGFRAFASQYDSPAFAADESLFGGERATMGLPFPYLVAESPVSKLRALPALDAALAIAPGGNPLTSILEGPLCSHGQE